MDTHPQTGTFALAELRERDRELGIDPSTPSPVIDLGPPAPAPPGIRELIEPVDWHEEERLRRVAEERARTARTQAELERIGVEAERATKPAGWQREQMRRA